jgi:ketosteroid isomerase-like protein
MNDSPLRLTSDQSLIDFYEAFSASDFATMTRMLHPDCVLDFPGSSFPNRVIGRDPIMALFRGVQAAMAGTLRFHPRWVLFKPPQAAIHWFTTGAPAHGGRYLNRGVAWFRLEDGLIREFQDFLDTEILAAFWPDGAPCGDFSRSHALVARLREHAPAAALERLDSFGVPAAE